MPALPGLIFTIQLFHQSINRIEATANLTCLRQRASCFLRGHSSKRCAIYLLHSILSLTEIILKIGHSCSHAPGLWFIYSRRTVVWHSNVSIPLTYNHTQTIEIAIIGNVAEKALHLILEWRRACLMAHRVSIETVTRNYAVFPWKQLSLHRCRLCE